MVYIYDPNRYSDGSSQDWKRTCRRSRGKSKPCRSQRMFEMSPGTCKDGPFVKENDLQTIDIQRILGQKPL